MKQGTLFSFFAPKQDKAAPAAPPQTAQAPPAASKKAPPSNRKTSVAVGTRIRIYWKDDDEYYEARVLESKGASSLVRYEADQTTEWIELGNEQYEVVQSESSKKRRVIESDDDAEEQEFEFQDDEEGSVYEQVAVEEDDAAEQDNWLVEDDDEEEEEKAPPKKKKTFKVTPHVPSQATTTPPHKRAKTSVNSFLQFSNQKASAAPITPSTLGSTTGTPFTPSPSTFPSPNNTNGPPMFEANVVNPAGSHVHHHLSFLHPPRDHQGRTPDHADYNPRTLRMDRAEWKRVTGKDMTAAVEQWWNLKAQYFDTILFFKTGKFYELYHMDADIGVKVLGLLYMKGTVAHAGFPEISYANMVAPLVAAGYKVARVEQTETPGQLDQRKKKKLTKKTPKVVNREVCSIVTAGTRTFCYLETADAAAATTTPTGGVGPLLAIQEVLLETTNDKDEMQPVCEYGVTLVDAMHGAVTIGQFADDVLRSRMQTLLTAYAPSEVLIHSQCSDILQSLLKQQDLLVEVIHENESFPKSTALDASIRQRMERSGQVRPWHPQETLTELHRRGYYPRASKKDATNKSTARWPAVLRAAVEGPATLALQSFGAVLYYLQRNLIDSELLSMGIVKAYVPPVSTATTEANTQANGNVELMTELTQEQQRVEDAVSDVPIAAHQPPVPASRGSTVSALTQDTSRAAHPEDSINHLSLDGTTLHNLEILTNSVDLKVAGSLWSKINYTKTPHGSRLLRAWLLRPLFRAADIQRRADAVQELVSGAASVSLREACSVLKQCGDIERLLSRVHSMSGAKGGDDDDDKGDRIHPNERAILYENGTYTKRKVGDFSKVLNGLSRASQIPELFKGVEIESGLLKMIVRPVSEGGCFPELTETLDWFLSNFDRGLAAKGLFEPSRGIDAAYDDACDTIERIQNDLDSYKKEMCSDVLSPMAASSWKYINTKPESKDKYLIELPASIAVPDDFIMKGKRGKGHKQVNKYRTAVVQQLVDELEQAFDTQKERKARGMQLIFAKFDSHRNLWAAAAQATAVLDALGSLTQVASRAGYVRPTILDCPPDSDPVINIKQGRHPCVDSSMFIPNDLKLGSSESERILLLSGPNMGGKSTLLRQTCLITIMAQLGSYVPAASCELTPVDRIYTRLGASDRLLLGQSTFFVELAETAAALRGATRRSLVIMDELGRGTSTFDGTAIAHAVLEHLVQSNQCLALFATHYHSLLEDWRGHSHVKLGHMECVVGGDQDTTITFLYTLGDGVCPKSFGINVARLAGLPPEVLSKASQISEEFDMELNGIKPHVLKAVEDEDWDKVLAIWKRSQNE